MDRAKAIDAITSEARKQRRRPSRGLWIVAALVGVACSIGFGVLMFADEDTSPVAKPARTASHDFGFTAGLVVGLVVGIALGFAIARQRHSSRSSP